ncbi:MAG: uridine kinase family protein [Gaiellaceae bacterium]
MAAEHETLAAMLGTVGDGVRARRLPDGMQTRVIAVDGLSGAGKSSFAEHLSSSLDGAEIAHTDDFASWDNPVDWWPDLIERLLVPLSRNRVARFERSPWGGADRGWAEVRPAELVILEGVTSSRAAFRPFVTYSVWIETPAELRLRRGLQRDGEEARGQWESWMAEEERYAATERPGDKADLVVRGDRDLWT